MYRKNTAGQSLGFKLVNATTGAALTGATVTVYRSIDGGAQATAAGSVAEKGNGQYVLGPAAADLNGNQISFLFLANGAVPEEKTVVTTAADPGDAQRLGLAALPAAGALAVKPAVTLAPADVSGNLPANVQATAASLAFNLTGNITGNLSGSVGTVTGAVGSVAGNVSGAVGSLAGIAFPTNFGSLAVDAGGRVLLQPSQPGVTIPAVTAVTSGVAASNLPAAYPIDFGAALPASPAAGTVGEALKLADTRLDAAVSSRLAASAYNAPANPTDYARNDAAPSWYNAAATPPTASAIAAQVWQTDLTSGYSGGQAGATLTSRAAEAGGNLAAVKAKTDALPGAFPAVDAGGRVLLQPSQPGVTIPAVTAVANAVNLGTAAPSWFAAATASQVAAAVWDQPRTGHTTAGTFGAYLDAAVSSRSSFDPAATGVLLSAAGLDAVGVETGVNARQALSAILAASAGVLSGAGTGSIVIKGGNVTATRIMATTDDSGNRQAVTLNLP